jgi:cytochrome c-type biogenesis protein CcmE
MNRKQTKILFLAAGILLCVGFLLFVGMKQPGGMVYYLTVSEFVEGAGNSPGGFRISGKVATGTVQRDAGGRDLAFVISDGASTLPVRYHGSIPDAFAEDADVVIQGRMADDGTFQAHTLTAKCPSKYEAAEKHPDDIPIGE